MAMSQLQNLADELNDVMGLEPKIDLEQDDDTLLVHVTAASKFLRKADEISDENRELLSSLGIGPWTKKSAGFKRTTKAPKSTPRPRFTRHDAALQSFAALAEVDNEDGGLVVSLTAWNHDAHERYAQETGSAAKKEEQVQAHRRLVSFLHAIGAAYVQERKLIVPSDAPSFHSLMSGQLGSFDPVINKDAPPEGEEEAPAKPQEKPKGKGRK